MAEEFTVPAGYHVIGFKGIKTAYPAQSNTSWLGSLFTATQDKAEPIKTVLEDSELSATDLSIFESYNITVRGTFAVHGVYLYLAQDGRDNFPAMYIQTLNTDGGFDCHASEVAMYVDKDVPHTELIVTLDFARKLGNPKARVVKRVLKCRLPSQHTLGSIMQTLEPADAVAIAKLAKR